MNTILIHNNNTSFLSEALFTKQYFFQLSSSKDADSYITEEFINEKLLMDLDTVNLVFIKISLSENYLEYLGMRLAYHLRLDSRVSNKKIPIVFLGEESLTFLLKTYDDYPILLTEGTYKIKDNRPAIRSFIESFNYERFKDIFDFDKFLNKIWIKPPANFESNHSIANEWGICRLFDAIKSDNNKYYESLKSAVNNLTFKNSLYFKYTEAKIDSRERFKKKTKKSINNLGFENLKVALIDDDYKKGWYDLYQFILDKSNAESHSFLGFSKEINKVDLIDKIKIWIKEEAIIKNGCNTFILDLRLHDNDFDKSSLEEDLTGIAIYKFIKSLNPGYQVIFVTASNKIWNIDSLDGVDLKNYIIKENPDYKFGIDNTLKFLTQFEQALSRCEKRYVLIEAYNLLEGIRQKRDTAKHIKDDEFLDLAFKPNGFFDQIYRSLDRGIESQLDLHQSILYCFHFFERYCDCREVSVYNGAMMDVNDYSIRTLNVINSKGNLLKPNKEWFAFQIPETDEKYKPIKSMIKLSTPHIDTYLGTPKAVVYSGVLYFRENCSSFEVDKLLELLFIRNNLSAHNTGKIKDEHTLKSSDVIFMLKLFDKIQF